MDFTCYLAMTAAECCMAQTLPPNIAWMACHFACYGTGLSNLPVELPQGSMVIINDILPPSAHDPDHIIAQLLRLRESQKISSILLDFQREGSSQTAIIAEHIYKALDCPVGISEAYAFCTNGPVFVSAPKPHQALHSALAPWKNREIWLEAAIETEVAIIKKDSCQVSESSFRSPPASAMESKALYSLYHTEVSHDYAQMYITRDAKQLKALLNDAKQAGVLTTVGLYQQLGNDFLSTE